MNLKENFTYKTISPTNTPTAEFHAHILGSVSPRPIALASTIDQLGRVNLSPFSFFNAFGSNPPIFIFSPARRVRDNTIKHTLENTREVPEVVINIVNYSMVEQVSLSSCEYPKDISEFVKSGLTPIPSTLVKPPRVAESPASFECKVNQIIETGHKGGAGNLIICEVLMAHFHTNIFDNKGDIDPQKIDTMARMGGDWYCRASGASVIKVPKPNQKLGIGFDNIPAHIKESKILTGNNLARLANVEALPSQEEINDFSHHPEISKILSEPTFSTIREEALHKLAQAFLIDNKVEEAWKVLLQTHS